MSEVQMNMIGGPCVVRPAFVLGNDLSFIWGDVDVTDEEATQYKNALLVHKEQISHIAHEAFLVCRHNFHKRLEVICDIWLHDLKESLSGANMEGPFGESPLLEATASENIECVRLLTRFGGKDLIMKACYHEDFQGSTALHIAVVNGLVDIIHELLRPLSEADRLAMLNMRITGRLYKTRLHSCELVLPLALWSGRGDIYDILLDYGADLGAVDEDNGDNLMHSLVRFSSNNAKVMCDMYRYVISSEKTRAWWCRKQAFPESWANTSRRVAKDIKHCLLRTQNKEGYVPLTLAARLELYDIFRAMIKANDVYRYPVYDFGRAMYLYYDMSDIDTNNTYPGMMSALELLAYSYKDSTLKCFTFQPMRKLMQLKWAAYSHMYFGLGLVHLVCMTIVTFSVIFRPLQTVSREKQIYRLAPLAESSLTPGQKIRWAAEVFVVLVAILYLALEILDIAKSVRTVMQLKRNSIEKFDRVWVRKIRPSYFSRVVMVYSLAIICWFSLRIAENPNEDIFMVIAAICGWHYVLYFTRGFPQIGFFTVMVHRMIFGDIFRFALVFLLVLVSFATAMMAVFQGSAKGIPPEFQSYSISIFNMFRLMAGLTELDVLEKARVPFVAEILFVAFVALAIVLLLNMLIAAMSDTYAQVSTVKADLMLKLQTCAALQIERRLPSCLRSSAGLEKRKVMIHGHIGDRWFLPVVEIRNKNVIAGEVTKPEQKKQNKGAKGAKGKGKANTKQIPVIVKDDLENPPVIIKRSGPPRGPDNVSKLTAETIDE